MSEPLNLSFVTSAPDVGSLPPTRAEVAVIGRSNVGKSSLLNAVARQRELAKTSSKPGKTQLLNCFSLDGSDRTVVDLPGYGYAHTSKTNRSSWQRRMEQYLTERDNLRLVLTLVDGEVGPTGRDAPTLEWLRTNLVPYKIVATKHDKVKSSKRERRKRDLAAGCQVLPADVLWVSAERNVNIDRLRELIRETLA